MDAQEFWSHYGTSVAVPIVSGLIIGGRKVRSSVCWLQKSTHTVAKCVIAGAVAYVKIRPIDIDGCGK